MVKKPLTLPPTKYGDFWEEAEIIKCDPEVKTTSQIHSWKQEGNYAYCTNCPLRHGLFIEILTQEVRDGNIVDKKTGELIYGKVNNQKTQEDTKIVDKE